MRPRCQRLASAALRRPWVPWLLFAALLAGFLAAFGGVLWRVRILESFTVRWGEGGVGEPPRREVQVRVPGGRATRIAAGDRTRLALGPIECTGRVSEAHAVDGEWRVVVSLDPAGAAEAGVRGCGVLTLRRTRLIRAFLR